MSSSPHPCLCSTASAQPCWDVASGPGGAPSRKHQVLAQKVGAKMGRDRRDGRDFHILPQDPMFEDPPGFVLPGVQHPIPHSEASASSLAFCFACNFSSTRRPKRTTNVIYKQLERLQTFRPETSTKDTRGLTMGVALDSQLYSALELPDIRGF